MNNISEIAKQTDQERILMTQIPPIELGNKGEEDFEEAQADRKILNRLISKTFRHNVNLTELNVEHNKQSVLDKDGFHPLDKGGKMMAAAIAKTTKELLNTLTYNPRAPRDENTTPRPTNRDSPEKAPKKRQQKQDRPGEDNLQVLGNKWPVQIWY